MQIELNDRDIERIKEICCAAAAKIAREEVGDEVRAAIKEAIEERMRLLADEALRPIIEEFVANGWPTTNHYGERNGAISFRQRVADSLFPKNGYDDPAARILRETLDRELKGELGNLLLQAKAKLASMLEGEILDKLRGYLRDGLALKK